MNLLVVYSFKEGLVPFFTLNWSKYSDILTFKGGLNQQQQVFGCDVAHHHLAIAVLFIALVICTVLTLVLQYERNLEAHKDHSQDRT
jgi:photosystem I P700 chlorophyll a apoprotein A1